MRCVTAASFAARLIDYISLGVCRRAVKADRSCALPGGLHNGQFMIGACMGLV